MIIWFGVENIPDVKILRHLRIAWAETLPYENIEFQT